MKQDQSVGTKTAFSGSLLGALIASGLYTALMALVFGWLSRESVFAPMGWMFLLAGAILLVLRYRLNAVIGLAIGTAAVLLIYAGRGAGYFEELEKEEAQLFSILFWFLLMGASLVVALVTGYFKRTAEIEEDREHLLERIFDTLPIGIWLRGHSGNTVFVNECWASFSGQSLEAIREGDPMKTSIDLGAEWEENVESILGGEGGLHYQSVELENEQGELCKLTLLTLGMYVDSEQSTGTLSLLFDETALRVYEEKVRTTENRLRSALNSATVGIWDRDHITRETYCDENWYRILGIENPKPGSDPLALWDAGIHPDDRARVFDAYDKFFERHDETIQIDYRLKLPVGGYRWVQDRLSVLEWTDNGEVKRSMGTLLDITERKKVENILMDSKERAESANIAKGHFIATVSHEIRTPLNAIIGLSSFLTESELDEEQLDLAQTISTSGKSLLLLVNDLLDFSKIEAGRLDLETQEFPIQLCLQDCVKLFRARAQEKDVSIQLKLEDSIPEFALGDMERLRQVVQNLLANAIKFTDSGRIDIFARRAVLEELSESRRPDPLSPLGFLDDADHEYIEVIVNDTGIGIPEDRQEELFEAFSQVDASASRRYEGTGLGLAICKRLVFAMGGRIWVDSADGEGAAFGFVIRTKLIREMDEQPSVLTKTPFDMVLPIAEEHPCDILVVGTGNSVDRMLLSCRKLGYAPHQSPSYELEDELFMRRHYDLVMIAVNDVDVALELSRRICARAGATRPKTVIAIVPEGMELPVERAKLVGIERQLAERPKPGNVRELILDSLSAHD
ncbi:MAG: ATP-binding protein [Verrucomicrobiota bacterium]